MGVALVIDLGVVSFDALRVGDFFRGIGVGKTVGAYGHLVGRTFCLVGPHLLCRGLRHQSLGRRISNGLGVGTLCCWVIDGVDLCGVDEQPLP